MSTAAQRIPVTLLTGYLGAGKTTLLNRILSADQQRRYAVIINEFGAVGIDGDLVVSSEENLFEMNNGCLCCTVRGDLIQTLHQLLASADRFDAVIIETTGLADPGPVTQTFFVDAKLQQHFELDSIVTLVDAYHLPTSLEQGPEAAEQLAFADQIVLNKCDLVSADTLAERQALLKRLNPFATQLQAVRSEVPLEQILHQGRFDLARLTTLAAEHGANDHHHGAHCDHDHDHHHPNHLHDIDSWVLTSDVPLDAERLSNWLTAFLAERGQDVLRVKGIVNIAGDDRKFTVQGVHMMVEGDFQEAWRPDETRQTQIVLIGRHQHQAALMAALQQCRADIEPTTAAGH